MRALLAIARPALAAIAIAGCATRPPAPAASVPIAVPCVAEKPAAPALVTDGELRAMSDYQLVLALWRYRLAAAGYIGELEAVVDGCARLAPAPGIASSAAVKTP